MSEVTGIVKRVSHQRIILTQKTGFCDEDIVTLYFTNVSISTFYFLQYFVIKLQILEFSMFSEVLMAGSAEYTFVTELFES